MTTFEGTHSMHSSSSSVHLQTNATSQSTPTKFPLLCLLLLLLHLFLQLLLLLPFHFLPFLLFRLQLVFFVVDRFARVTASVIVTVVVVVSEFATAEGVLDVVVHVAVVP